MVKHSKTEVGILQVPRHFYHGTRSMGLLDSKQQWLCRKILHLRQFILRQLRDISRVTTHQFQNIFLWILRISNRISATFLKNLRHLYLRSWRILVPCLGVPRSIVCDSETKWIAFCRVFVLSIRRGRKKSSLVWNMTTIFKNFHWNSITPATILPKFHLARMTVRN